LKKKTDSEKNEIWIAVRCVKNYFFLAAEISEMKEAVSVAGRQACFKYGVELFFTVVQPIDKYRKADRKPFDDLRTILLDEPERLLQFKINEACLLDWDKCDEGH